MSARSGTGPRRPIGALVAALASFASAPAGAADDAPVAVVEDEGFKLELPDHSYQLAIRGLLQADGRFFFDEKTLEADDTFLIRRFRPSIEGTLFSLVDFRLMPEFASSTVQILDAYADIHAWDWLHLRMGKFKPPVGLERLQSEAEAPLLEIALDQNLSPDRDIGVELWGRVAGGIARYRLGIVNGAVDGTSPSADINHAKDLVLRIFFEPFQAKGLSACGSLGVGIAGAIGNRKGRLPTATAAAVTGLPVFKTAGQNTFFEYDAPATDTTGAMTTFAHELASRLNPQLYYYYGPFGLLTEYILLHQGVQKGGSTGTLTHQAAHVTVSFAINGTIGYDGVTPRSRFDRKLGHWGALQLAAAVGWLRADPDSFGDSGAPGAVQYADPTKSARSALSFAGGVTWVPRRSFHLAADFEHTSFDGGAGTAGAIVDRTAEKVLICRAQVSF
jgi:phosphate-selective porin OprO/OprP